MADYVDGFVVPVPRKNLAVYSPLNAESGQDVDGSWRAGVIASSPPTTVKPGKLTSFPQAVKLKEDETVVLAWIVFKSRKHRDAVNAKVMKDPRMQHTHEDGNSFDGRRLIYGGFQTDRLALRM